jgi:hypothetical protein
MKNILESIRREKSREDIHDALKEVVIAFIVFGIIGLVIGVMTLKSPVQVALFFLGGGLAGALLVFIRDFGDIVAQHRQSGAQMYGNQEPKKNGVPLWVPAVNSGWIRLGIALTGVWLVVVIASLAWLVIDDYAVDVPQSLAVMFGVPLGIWVVAFLAVLAWGWIRAGFQAGSTSKK